MLNGVLLGYNWIDALPQQGGTRLDEHSSAFVVEKFRIVEFWCGRSSIS
jgi:hypothetical protein